MKRAAALALPAMLAIGLALRLVGVTSFPPSDAEALGIGVPWFLPVDIALVVPRLVGALLSAIAIWLVAGVSRDESDASGAHVAERTVAFVAPLLLALDPLSILAAHESPRAAALCVLGAAIVTWERATEPRARRLRLAIGIAALAFIAICRRSGAEPVPPDPSRDAWLGYAMPWTAARLATIHHLGYALVPLALGALRARWRVALPMIAIDLVVLDPALGEGARLADHAFLAPLFVTLAADVIASLRRAEIERARQPLAVLGLLGLVIAVNAPILLSDAMTGMRFPWHVAARWLEERKDVDRTKVVVYTPTPATARRVLGDGWQVEALPDFPTTLLMLEKPGDRIVVLPVNAGLAHARHIDDQTLGMVEYRKVADLDLLARRFDLYRLELRGFRFE